MLEKQHNARQPDSDFPAMRAFRILLIVTGWMLVPTSIIPLLFSFFLLWHTLHFLQSASRAQGTLISLTEKNDKDGTGSKVYYPVYQFRDSEGNEHEIQSPNGWAPATVEFDRKVTTLDQRDEHGHPDLGESVEMGSSETWFAPHKLGSKATIFYKRDNPADAEPFVDVWESVAEPGAFGGVPLLLALGMFFAAHRIGRDERRSTAARGVIDPTVPPPMPPPLPTPAFNSMEPSPLYPNTISYQIPRGELIRLGYVLGFRRLRVIRGILGFLALAVVFCFLGLKSGAFASLLIAAALPLLYLWIVIRAVRSPDVSGPRTVAFGASGMVMAYRHYRGKSAWSRFKRFREDATYFYLYDAESAGNPIVWIPRAALTPEQTEEFRRYVNALNVRPLSLEEPPLTPPDLSDPTEAALYTHTASYQIPRDVLIRLTLSLGFSRLRIICLVFGFLVIAASLYFNGAGTASFVFILLGISFPLLRYWTAIRIVDNRNLALPTTLSFGPAGIVLGGSNYRIESAWIRFKAFSEDANYLYLCNTKGSRLPAVVVPKAALSAQQQEKFRRYGSALNVGSGTSRS